MKNIIKLTILIIACVVLLLIIYTNYDNKTKVHQEGVVISEVVTKNDSIVTEEDLDFSDYIEIYNNSSLPKNLLGYGLTDNPNLPYKWTFPNITIEPYEYLLVFADKKDIMAIYPHTNFALSSKGEAVILTDGEGNTLSRLIIGECVDNMAYTLQDDEYVYCETGSPLKKSKEKIIGDTQKYITDKQKYGLTFNKPAGFYKKDFYLEILANTKKAVIRYTTDGSMPTMQSNIYTEPIHITARKDEENKYIPINTTYLGSYNPPSNQTKRATVIKAQIYINDKPKGDVITKTFFVDEKEEDMYSIPVMSISTDPENFWSDEKGIYVVGQGWNDGVIANYDQRGIEWERPVYVEYFQNGKQTFEQNLGARIFGGGSRYYQKKSIKLYARNKYGNNKIYYSFFDELNNIQGNPIEMFSKIGIRNGGNDWEFSLFRDSLTTGIASSVIDTQASQPIIVFINGEYYGIYFLREIMDSSYIENHYGVLKDDVAIIAINREQLVIEEGTQKDVKEFEKIINFSKENDLSIEENYNYIKSKIDLKNLIEYYVAEMYLANPDWPANNSKVWRMRTNETLVDAKPGQDGKYRFLLYDTELGMGDTFEDVNYFTYILNNEWAEEGKNVEWSTAIIRGLMKNTTFRHQFINTFCDRLNTTYSTKKVQALIANYEKILENEVEENMQRYGILKNKGITEWYEYIEKLNNFAQMRPTDIFIKMAEYYQEMLGTLSVKKQQGGSIKVNNNIVVGKTDDFKGTYLTHVSITLTAIPDDGYRFVKWSNGKKSESIKIMFTEESLHQMYVPTFKEIE